MKKYYRVVGDFFGEEHTFVPKDIYEYVDFRNNIPTYLGGNSDIKEVCFSKRIPRAFFAIAPFLVLDKTYYIYETDVEPCIDLSEIKEGDFEATQEVRYRKPVYTKYIGKFRAHENFHENITELYRECCYGEKGQWFDCNHATFVLSNRYDLMYEEIEFISKEKRDEFIRPKVTLISNNAKRNVLNTDELKRFCEELKKNKKSEKDIYEISF